MLRNSFRMARFMTPYITGLMQAEKVENNRWMNSIEEGIFTRKPNSKIETTIKGVQQMKKANTAAKSTRDVFISCALMVLWLFGNPCEGKMALLCFLTTL